MSNAFKTYVVASSLLAMTAAPAAATPDAQNTRPDFSGIWMVVPVAAAPAAASGGVGALPPTPITIRHTATSLSIDRTAFGQVTTMTFTIDSQKDDTNRTGAQVWTTKTRWEGKALLTTGHVTQNTTAGFEEWSYSENRSLDARGQMVVETRQVTPDGKVTTNKREFARQRRPSAAPDTHP